MSVAFCYLRVVSRWLARVILPELILDRSGLGGNVAPTQSAQEITMAHRAPRTNAPENFRFSDPFHKHVYLSSSDVSKKIYLFSMPKNKQITIINKKRKNLFTKLFSLYRMRSLD